MRCRMRRTGSLAVAAAPGLRLVAPSGGDACRHSPREVLPEQAEDLTYRDLEIGIGRQIAVRIGDKTGREDQDAVVLWGRGNPVGIGHIEPTIDGVKRQSTRAAEDLLAGAGIAVGEYDLPDDGTRRLSAYELLPP